MTVTIVSGVCGVSDAPSVSATLPTPCEMLERNRRAGFPRIRDPSAPTSGRVGTPRQVVQQIRRGPESVSGSASESVPGLLLDCMPGSAEAMQRRRRLVGHGLWAREATTHLNGKHDPRKLIGIDRIDRIGTALPLAARSKSKRTTQQMCKHKI